MGAPAAYGGAQLDRDGWSVVGKDAERVESLLQYGLLLAAWVVAFLLGKELQTGFAQWRARRRSEQK
jgi:hypothetical protein